MRFDRCLDGRTYLWVCNVPNIHALQCERCTHAHTRSLHPLHPPDHPPNSYPYHNQMVRNPTWLSSSLPRTALQDTLHFFSGLCMQPDRRVVLGRDVQLTVSLLSSNLPIPQPNSDPHTDSVPSCAESTLVRRARRGRISRASLCTTSTPSRAAQRTRSAHPSYTPPGAAPSRRSKRRGSRRRRTRARGLPRSSVCWTSPHLSLIEAVNLT